MIYDVIIIGAGPAGITASLYAKRTNLSVLVLYKDESALEKAEKIENYYGFPNGISGKELYQNGIMQAKNLGIELKKEEVIKIEKIKETFEVSTSNRKYISRNVILATGNKKNTPDIKGIKELEGKGISYCAICDGFFYRGKDVAVLGSGDYAISEVNDLLNVANKITILTNKKKVPDFRAENVKVETRGVIAVKGENQLESIELEDGTKLEVDGLFVAQGVAGSTDFARKLGALVKDNKIVVSDKMETTIQGLYACGDCVGGIYQIAKAINEGMIAGISAVKDK